MKPVLLLIPGMLNDATVWRATATQLAPVADVRIMDTLGHDSIAPMAAAAWQAVDDVPAAVPLLIAGFSLGGYVALHMLAHPARRLAGAALVSTSAQPESPEGMVRREKTIQAIEADFARVVDGILQWGTCEAGASVLGDLRAMMLAIGPDTFGEQGVPELEIYIWSGLSVPGATPDAVIARLNTEFNRVIASPEIREKWRALDFEPMPMSPSQFRAYVQTDSKRWAEAVKVSGFKVNE